eukprot:Amastigsp_a177374_26.p4 type:complete len:140 gc:universal Amastigsp_a177374_26:197-616(+)
MACSPKCTRTRVAGSACARVSSEDSRTPSRPLDATSSLTWFFLRFSTGRARCPMRSPARLGSLRSLAATSARSQSRAFKPARCSRTRLCAGSRQGSRKPGRTRSVHMSARGGWRPSGTLASAPSTSSESSKAASWGCNE